MRFLVLIAIAGSIWMAGVLQARTQQPATGEKPATAQQPTTTWGGVYTEAQAKAGEDAYMKVCAECHGEDLGGDGYAPLLKGPDFMTNWNGLSVAEFFDRIRVSMPPDNPNAVSPKEKADIVAHILKGNGFPAGTSELPATAEGMKSIKIEATKAKTKPGR